MHNINDQDMPVGLKMALTQDVDVLNKFATLSKSEQDAFIQGAHQVNSKQDMQTYVNNLMQG